ncbi:tagatose-bisphosphate aldolase [Mammaliicoccus sciuri]|uniref:tagatose-bisphosphate aldolase n=1 Tax=Mammaliicoccus sciuri TaxID=1296 RepID=UPI001F223EFB|nr:tagatose-bisphosphate aldolase [Mammaliicoccus sciuri]MCE4980288.1 tagatose-bisphosphate aldolase [Mammaliicoccus sciuri]MCE5084859.1 tagatose-bisphosphate aldolase [Mammaliicoccus sciuri]MCE5094642.1 tagatose-bisphosphate aldolase [Mammaliicoccus sciuri]
MKSLKKLTNNNGIITALAIDQRGALKRMMGENISYTEISNFKELVSNELTPYASSILLDPEFGIEAANIRVANCGLIMAYEKTGYDKKTPGRIPDLIPNCSVKNLKSKGADAIKLLIYVDINESDEINSQKEAFVERVGSECVSESLPFFLEILTYDDSIGDEKGIEFAKIKPHKVINAMRLYSESRFNVDVLKVEVPVNMNFVEGYAKNEYIYTKEEAAEFFLEQSNATNLPFIFLSAGVSSQLFLDTLNFAYKSGSKFNGVLCGRATWSDAAKAYVDDGINSSRKQLKSTCKNNILELNKLVEEIATPI